MSANPQRDLSQLPVVPLKASVLYPYITQPISVGRDFSVAAIETAFAGEDKRVLVVAQRDASVETPSADDLYGFGTCALVKQVAKLPNGHLQVLIEGLHRASVVKIDQTAPYLRAIARTLPARHDAGARVEALSREVSVRFNEIVELTGAQVPVDVRELLSDNTEPQKGLYLAASLIGLDVEREQALLEAETLGDALNLLHGYLNRELSVLQLRQKIADRAEGEINDQQRRHILREQLRAIRKELGDAGDGDDVSELEDRLAEADLPESVRAELERELQRLESVPAASPEHSTLRSYVEFALELPWNDAEDHGIEIAKARSVLDADHFGLDEVKERILEHLGVLQLNPEAKAPILCFVGPPGVGKTSLGQSIARALGRQFERQSLGGLYDEAELRGHRRTYVGAMPGRILQTLRRAGVKNPVVMLDELDKVGRDYRGDPAAALLEILDPEQNVSFRDNYLDLPFDLSKVLFVATANTLDTIPGPLRDRLEVIRIPGYSEEEKREIANRYLIPRAVEDVGLTAVQCSISPDAVAKTISGYTREGGVRELNRQLRKLARKVALQIAEGTAERVEIDAQAVSDLLGPERFFFERTRRDLPAGVATGLAWTPVGGDVLHVEASLLPDGKDVTITGQLGDVMRESAQIARSYVWAHADELGIEAQRFVRSGVHLHVPSGAIPKDGPSAGITIATALASLYTGCVVRGDTAFTGEITLTGLVLPVGGIKEKVLAARRAGKRRVVLSRENERDLARLPDDVREELEFVLVDRMSEVLEAAFDGTVRRTQPRVSTAKRPCA